MKKTLNLVSTCCGAEPLEDYKMSFRDHHESIPIYTCPKCQNECEVDDNDPNQANDMEDANGDMIEISDE